MRVLERTVFIGANVYAHYPVIRLHLDLGALEDWPSRRLGESFITPLLEAFPGLATHGCSYSVAGGFVRRLREDEGTWMGHILEHLALEVQHLAGSAVAYGKTRSTGRRGEYYLVYAYEDVEVGIRAGEIAERFLRSIIPAELHGGPAESRFDLRSELAELLALACHRQATRLAEQSSGGEQSLPEPLVVLVAGEESVSDVARGVAEILEGFLGSVGLADAVGASGERDLLRERHDAVVIATTRRLLLDSGVAVRRCDAAGVLGRLHGRRDPLQLPMEIAGRSAHVINGSASAAAERIVELVSLHGTIATQ